MYSMNKLHPMNNLQTFYENTRIINEHPKLINARSMNSPNLSHEQPPQMTMNNTKYMKSPCTSHKHHASLWSHHTSQWTNTMHYEQPPLYPYEEQPHIPMNKHHEFLWSTTTHPNEQRTNTTHPYEQTPHILMNSHHASYWANNMHSYEPPHIPMNKLIPCILTNNHHTSQWTNTHHRVLHTLDVAADNCLTGDFRLARPHWNNMARLSCHAKYPNPLQMYGWVICFEINCTWKQMSHRVMFAYRCWPEI